MMVITKATKKDKAKEKVQKVKKSDSKQKKVPVKSSFSLNSVKDIEIKWDKVLEKVEKMVEKNWDMTEKDIRKRKSERKPDDFKDINLDVMVSRISEDSKKKSESNVLFTKNLLYFIYFLIIIAIVIFSAKWLLMSQNG